MREFRDIMAPLHIYSERRREAVAENYAKFPNLKTKDN